MSPAQQVSANFLPLCRELEQGKPWCECFASLPGRPWTTAGEAHKTFLYPDEKKGLLLQADFNNHKWIVKPHDLAVSMIFIFILITLL